jgi:hypothetical protein
VTTWSDLPKQPWPEATQPDPADLADWLRALPREQLIWLLNHQQQVWSEESICFGLNHEGEIAYLRSQNERLAQRIDDMTAVLMRHGVLSS